MKTRHDLAALIAALFLTPVALLAAAFLLMPVVLLLLPALLLLGVTLPILPVARVNELDDWPLAFARTRGDRSRCVVTTAHDACRC
jgi:hypothetical protein